MGREPVSLYDPIYVIFWKGQTRMAKNGSVVARDWGALGAFGGDESVLYPDFVEVMWIYTRVKSHITKIKKGLFYCTSIFRIKNFRVI